MFTKLIDFKISESKLAALLQNLTDQREACIVLSGVLQRGAVAW